MAVNAHTPRVGEKIQLDVSNMDMIEVMVRGYDSNGRAHVSFWVTESEMDIRTVLSDPVQSPDDPSVHTYVLEY